MTYPSWWGAGVRVVGQDGRLGTVAPAGREGWLIQLDGYAGQDISYIVEPDPEKWRPEIRQLLTAGQRDRIVHDAERALLRAFGCHYVPEFEALPESVRAKAPRPRAVGRPELDGLQNIIRGAISAALSPYTQGL